MIECGRVQAVPRVPELCISDKYPLRRCTRLPPRDLRVNSPHHSSSHLLHFPFSHQIPLWFDCSSNLTCPSLPHYSILHFKMKMTLLFHRLSFNPTISSSHLLRLVNNYSFITYISFQQLLLLLLTATLFTVIKYSFTLFFFLFGSYSSTHYFLSVDSTIKVK